jgi:hypothetical protein
MKYGTVIPALIGFQAAHSGRQAPLWVAGAMIGTPPGTEKCHQNRATRECVSDPRGSAPSGR